MIRLSWLNGGQIHAVAVSLLMVATGCGRFAEHQVVNVGSETLYEVSVACDGKILSHGVLIPGAHKSYHGSFTLRSGPITVSWRDGQGARFTRTVVLGSSGTATEAVFSLDGREVAVSLQ